MKWKKWNFIVIGGTVGILFLIAGAVAWIDPFLHYHQMCSYLEYPLKDERYQNDGILRNYSYDAVITGTSMSQNFKPSEFDALWNAQAVKTCYSGATYAEVNDNINRAFGYNGNIKYVVRSLDPNLLNTSSDKYEYDGVPFYLYDRNPFNDTQYLLNKEVIPKAIAVINYTRSGQKTPDWDLYENWSIYKNFGKEEVFRTWSEYEETESEYFLSAGDYEQIEQNIRQNVLQTALDHPDVVFYVFIPPYSICYWDTLVRTKQLNAEIETEKYALEILFEADNIHVYSFADKTDMIADLDNYTDALHYGEWVNSDILKWMKQGEGELTQENYEEFYDHIKEIYLNYDFSELHN